MHVRYEPVIFAALVTGAKSKNFPKTKFEGKRRGSGKKEVEEEKEQTVGEEKGK